jgi:hypothetical protein
VSEPVEFLASIAPTDGSLKASGVDGFRMLLDIPESETPAYVRLLLCRGKVLKVKIEIEGERPLKRKAGRGKPRKLTEAEWGDDDGDENEAG